MRIALIGFTKIAYMPYMHFYINQINTPDNELHLIYWQRDDIRDVAPPDNVQLHPFCHNMSDSLPLRKKIPSIMAFGRYAKGKIKEINPDFLIVMHSTTAFTIRSILFRNFSNKYIFDFRDVTYERKFGFYRNFVAKVVKHSALTFTSSDAYRQFLPDCNKIITSHNLLMDQFEVRGQYKHKTERDINQPIRIAFWGLLRHYDLNAQFITRFGNDPRFELHYYGRAQGAMAELMNSSTNEYNNIFYHGAYMPNDRNEFAKNTDLIHNVYSNLDTNMPFAMGNKYYDGVIYYIPQLCMRGSFMGQKCNQYHIGLEIDLAEIDCADRVWEYYNNINLDKFYNNCDQALQIVISEYNKGCEMIRNLIYNNKKRG